MTKQTKLIIAAAAGVAAIGGFLLVLVVAVVGFSMIKSAGDKPDERPAANEKRATRNSPRITTRDGALAPELVGTWTHRAGTGETDFTGKTRYGSKRARVYEFRADGTAEYALERETLTIMQCEVKESRRASGTASTAGELLVLNLDETAQTETDSCEGGEAVEKTLPGESIMLQYRLQTDEATGARQLCLIETDGEACFEKKE